MERTYLVAVIEAGAVGEVERETASYYDAEQGREDRPLDPRRVAARDRFVSLVGRAHLDGPVLEIGTGPGRDALALVEAGLRVVGVDLSAGHAGRARARGLTMAVGSARALPFASGSMGGLWSMSTLMHVPAVAIEQVMREIRRVMAPGAPVAIGVWGGPDDEYFDESPNRVGEPRRLFSRRSEGRWRALLQRVGELEDFAIWEYTGAGAEVHAYHLGFVTASVGTAAL